jgi:CelD/BcsL family acetyltransferase involved in cellulose biosynthesis
MASTAQFVEGSRVVFLDAHGLLSPEFAREWDELATASSEPNCFLERWFLAASLRHLGAPHSLRVAVVRTEHGQLIGLMPLHISENYGRLPFAHVRNWLHHNSFLASPLVRAGSEDRFWNALIDALDGEKWAKGLLHLSHLAADSEIYAALLRSAAGCDRSCDVVHQSERAILEHGLDAKCYYEATVRPKKRKEIRRLQSRLSEMGTITTETLSTPFEAEAWITQFLQLEGSGWKGDNGSSLGSAADTRGFFGDLVRDGLAAGRVELVRLSLDDRPLAMLVNFIALPGSFQFKIAYDEDFARYSPGVLIELDNYKILERDGFGWMDSCAAEDHPMIDSLWSGRRSIVWVAVPLGGVKHALLFKCVRWAENGWKVLKRMQNGQVQPANDNRIPSDD